MTKNTAAAIAKRIDGHRNILGVPVFGGRKAEVLEMGGNWIAGEGGVGLKMVVTLTTEQVVLAQHDPVFCASLMQSTLNVADTVGIQQALKLKERIPGVELAEAWVGEAVKQGKKVFLLGGRPGVAEMASERYKIPANRAGRQDTRYKSLVAWDEGAREIERETEIERERVLNRILEFKPVLVLVSYGAPWQEKWIAENAAALGAAGVKIALGVGGAFDMWAQKVPRAPLQWRKLGLEWLWRLIHEPWRWKRQLRLIEFVARVVAERVGKALGWGSV